jgi:hypothetical protein
MDKLIRGNYSRGEEEIIGNCLKLLRCKNTKNVKFFAPSCSRYNFFSQLILQKCLKRGYTVKKRLKIFPSPAGMSLTRLSLARNNFIIPGEREFGK